MSLVACRGMMIWGQCRAGMCSVLWDFFLFVPGSRFIRLGYLCSIRLLCIFLMGGLWLCGVVRAGFLNCRMPSWFGVVRLLLGGRVLLVFPGRRLCCLLLR